MTTKVNSSRMVLWCFLFMLSTTVILAGCSSDSGSQPSPARNSTTPTATTAQEEEQPVQLTWMVRNVVLDNSFGERYVEENFNVELSLISIPSADYVQRQQIMMTTGEVPDVMLVMDPNELKKYADQGLLAEIPLELIEQYAPRTKAEFDEYAPQGWFYTEHKGENYGIPTLYPSGRFTTPVTWRTDLLKAAGINEIPTTIDEMTEAFEALKQIGVYGMTSNGNSYYLTFQKIFGAYGVMPMQWMVRDGQIVNGAILPEAKEALTTLASWYSNGYIDPEFVTGSDIAPKFVDGVFAFQENAHISSLDETNPNSVVSTIKNINPDGEIAFGPLPVGPRGESGGWAWGGAGNMYVFGRHMKDHPEKIQRVLEIIESSINDEEVYFTLAFGEQGTHWEFVNGTDYTEGVRPIPPYDDQVILQEEGIGQGQGQSFFGGNGSFQFYEMYTGEYLMGINNMYLDGSSYDVFGKPDILPSAGQYWGDLQKLKIEAYAQIIRGDQPIDYFDSFVQQWNDMGGEQLRQEGQALYDSLQ